MTRLQVAVEQASLNAAIRRLALVSPRVGRHALRKGVAKAGSETLKQVKAAAPVGRTGQFKRSMGKKDIRYAARGTYQSIVGHRYDKKSTARQIASANKKTGSLSKGLSGRGFSPAVWWMEKGTRPHFIGARGRARGKQLAWNIVAGGAKISPPRFAKVVRHPGHRGTGFMRRTETVYRAQRIRTIRSSVQSELLRLGQA